MKMLKTWNQEVTRSPNCDMYPMSWIRLGTPARP
jgi:hypothetical protein